MVNGLVVFEGILIVLRDNFENVYVFLNFVRFGFIGNVIIDGLMVDVNVKIIDIEGNLVFEIIS